MGILLLLLGALAALSGGLKLRPRVRSLLGTSPLAVIETAAGALTVIGSGLGLARLRPLAWTVVVVVAVLIVASTATQVRRALDRQRARRASEELRFATRFRGNTRS